MRLTFVSPPSSWRLALRACAVALFVTLSACGGGGDGGAGGGVTPPAPVTPPAITVQPASLSVGPGGSATFSVTATGAGLAYQWQRSTTGGLGFAPIAGATSNSYTLSPVQSTMNGDQFLVVIQNVGGTVSSAAATLTVPLAAAPAAFTLQPQNQTSNPSAAAAFTVAVSGSPAPTIQWQVSLDGGASWNNLGGATGTSYNTSSNFGGAGVASNNARQYRAVASNASGTATSNAATWSVRPATLGGQPTSLLWDANGELSVLTEPNYALFLIGSFANRGAALVQRVSAGGSVSTLAGSGVEGLVNGPGAGARFNVGGGSTNSAAASGIGRDSAGNLYIADLQNFVIRKVAPDGNVATFAGSGLRGTDDGPLTSARFDLPWAVVVASDGTVYVADNSRLRVIAAGQVSTLGVLSSSTSLAIDAADTLYGITAATVSRRTAAGVSSQVGGIAGLNVTEDASVNMRLTGLVVDASGTMYATDGGLCLVRKITTGGVVTTLAGGPLLATDRCGYTNGTGRAARFGPGMRGIAIDAAGNLYVADAENLAIRKITPAGVVTTLAR